MNTMSKVNDTIDIGSEAETDLLLLVHEDNSAAAELFFQFTQAEEDEDKQDIFDRINLGLTIHAQLVEELLYPLVVETAEQEDKEEAEKLVAEAEAGNYVASLILDALNSMQPDDQYFEAKMTILCELTKLQVKREEKEMFDKLRAAKIDFDDIGDEAAERKVELVEEAQSSKAKLKSKNKTKLSAKSGARKVTSKPTAKLGKPARKPTPSNKKGTAKTAAKIGRSTKKSADSKAAKKKAGSTKPTARSKSSAKSVSKKRSR
jgi:hypothetical protein